MIPFIPFSQIAEEDKKEYSLVEYARGGEIFRHENTALGTFDMSELQQGIGSFKLKIPKIPQYVITGILGFFVKVFHAYNTEVAVQLFYDLEEKEYFVYLPKQRVAYATVNFERSVELEFDDRYILCADIHSHGKISAFFSAVDDADEKGTRLFGVAGGFPGNPSFLVRAGSGGYFHDLELKEVIDFSQSDNDRSEEIKENLWAEQDEALSFL